MSPDARTALRALPSVDELVRAVLARGELASVSRPRVTAVAREILDAERGRVVDGQTAAADLPTLESRVIGMLAGGRAFSLRPVVNATGVVLHTNLGRAVLSAAALERIALLGASYGNLELDIATKERGSRYSHVEKLAQRLTGAEDVLVVNNNAAAVLLALETLASGREVIVSRGELIEIGGEFRIPDIMRRSGARLVEVGATNRTHRRDYADAIGPNTGLLLKVHTSNYRIVGFTSDVSSRELCALGRERGIPVMEDLGSGSLIDFRQWGFPYEPTVPEVVDSGVDLVSFSGDKLLGGPQAGIVVGRNSLVGRLKKNPWNRALRIDKFTIASLEATLAAYDDGTALETVPTLRLLTEPLASIRRRARRLLTRLDADSRRRLGAEIVEDHSEVGGGALPEVKLHTAALALGATPAASRALDEALRRADPPVIGRIVRDRLLLDCRTIRPGEISAVAAALIRA